MNLPSLLLLSAETRDLCAASISAIGDALTGKPANELLFVQSSLALRLNRLHAGIETLTRGSFPAEAAILALTMFECRLDILYIGSSQKRAKDWMQHTNHRQHLWPVRTKIESIFRDQPVRQKWQRELFKFLSEIKHGNPTSGSLGFGFRLKGATITVGNSEKPDEVTTDFCRFICHSSSLQLMEGTLATLDALDHGTPSVMVARKALLRQSGRLHQLIEPIAVELDRNAAATSSWVTPAVLMANLKAWGLVGRGDESAFHEASTRSRAE